MPPILRDRLDSGLRSGRQIEQVLGIPSERDRIAPHISATKRLAGGGARWGILVACYEPATRRRSPLDGGSPETNLRSCGNQPAHESLLNRRLDTPPPAKRFHVHLSLQRMLEAHPPALEA